MTSASPPPISSSKTHKLHSPDQTMVFPAFPFCPQSYSKCTKAQSKIYRIPFSANRASLVCKINCSHIVTFPCWSSRKSVFYFRKIQTRGRTKKGYSRTLVFCGRGTFYSPSTDFRKSPCCGSRQVQKRWCQNRGRSRLQGPHRRTWICGCPVAISLWKMKGKSHT
jgi:hypothetical protein